VLVAGQGCTHPVATGLVRSTDRAASAAIAGIRTEVHAAAVTRNEGVEAVAQAGTGVTYSPDDLAGGLSIGQAAALARLRITDTLQTANDKGALLQQRIADALARGIVEDNHPGWRAGRHAAAAACLLPWTAAGLEPADTIDLANATRADVLGFAGCERHRQAALRSCLAIGRVVEQAAPVVGRLGLPLCLPHATVVGGVARRGREPCHHAPDIGAKAIDTGQVERQGSWHTSGGPRVTVPGRRTDVAQHGERRAP